MFLLSYIKKKEQYSKKKKKMSNFNEKCYRITQILLDHPVSKLFSHRIDEIIDQAPGYYEIIKNPMDLGTIMEKVENGMYKNMKEWISDVNLVWSNSILYNTENSYIAIAAHHLQDIFKKELIRSGGSSPSEWMTMCNRYYLEIKKQMQSSPKPLKDFYAAQDFSIPTIKPNMREISDLGQFTNRLEVLQVLQILTMYGYKPDTKREELTIDVKDIPEEALPILHAYIKEGRHGLCRNK